jgi:N-methylhydantoinase A
VSPSRLRIGIDVGGTFTKAVAVEPGGSRLHAAASIPTSHGSDVGVTRGVVEALERLLGDLGRERKAVELVAFSTTQAMNALLEGDVGTVGVLGIGAAPELRLARRRTRIGDVALAPGRSLITEHEFLDASGGLAPAEIDAALGRLREQGCCAIAISGAFSVDAPAHEELVAQRALALGLPACAGHTLTGAYGLETRTVSAAINAAILPVVERTAGIVEAALARAELEVPLLVLRGDGGAMATEAFRRRPSFTVGSGPAAGVAAALHEVGVSEAVVLECGGTSSNVSVISRGRPALRTLKVMGRPTAIRSIDSWVIGAAGGSMARAGRRRVREVGPRSAHVAGLPYSCFAKPAELEGAELELVAPRDGDPSEYAVVRAGGRRYALTATCAANALGLVAAEAHAKGSREAALSAFGALGRRIRTSPEQAAEALLTGAVRKVADAVSEAANSRRFADGFPLVALGGAAEALAPEVARRVGAAIVRPEHPEVLSSIGAALSLVRAEVVRTPSVDNESGEPTRLAIAHEAERACVEAGAAPNTVAVETSYEPGDGVVRAVATGAVALETGAARRKRAAERERVRAAAGALGIGSEALSLLAAGEFYLVYSENGSGRVAAVDPSGGVPLAENARSAFAAEGEEFLRRLRDELEAASVNLGVAAILPRVALVCGPRILDLSDARRPEEILAAAERLLAEHDETAVAVLAR